MYYPRRRVRWRVFTAKGVKLFRAPRAVRIAFADSSFRACRASLKMRQPWGGRRQDLSPHLHPDLDEQAARPAAALDLGWVSIRDLRGVVGRWPGGQQCCKLCRKCGLVTNVWDKDASLHGSAVLVSVLAGWRKSKVRAIRFCSMSRLDSPSLPPNCPSCCVSLLVTYCGFKHELYRSRPRGRDRYSFNRILPIKGGDELSALR